MTNTVAFAIFPFTHKGIHFISKVSELSRHLPMIINIKDEFIKMNTNAIDELMPNIDEMSHIEILATLEILNEGGSEMFLEMVGME